MMCCVQVENVTEDGAVVKKTLVDTEEWKKPNGGAKVCSNCYPVLPDTVQCCVC